MRVHEVHKIGRYCPIVRRRIGGRWHYTTTRGVSPRMYLDSRSQESYQHILGSAKELRMIMIANVRQTSLSSIVLYIGQQVGDLHMESLAQNTLFQKRA